MLITIIDKDKQKHKGRLYLTSTYTTEAEEHIAEIIDTLEYEDLESYDKAIKLAQELPKIIEYCKDYYLRDTYSEGGVDVDYKDFLPSDVKWKYTK